MKIAVRTYDIVSGNITKELSGYRIALFSDTHNMYYGPGGEEILRLLDNGHPDIVCFAGDAVRKSSRNTDPQAGWDHAAELFTSIAARYPLYYVTGNHDRRWRKLCRNTSIYGNYMSQLRRAGVHILSNDSALTAGGSICLTGLDLPLPYYRHGTRSIDHIERFIGRPKKDAFNLLLAHTPVFFPEYAAWGADLVLSGHIHGGVLRLPVIGGVLSPHRSLFPTYDYGKFCLGEAAMIVSSGVGDHNPRLQLTNPYEIVIITLKAKEQVHGS